MAQHSREWSLVPGWHPVLVPSGVEEVRWRANGVVSIGPSADGELVHGRTGNMMLGTDEIIGIGTEAPIVVRLEWQ